MRGALNKKMHVLCLRCWGQGLAVRIAGRQQRWGRVCRQYRARYRAWAERPILHASFPISQQQDACCIMRALDYGHFGHARLANEARVRADSKITMVHRGVEFRPRR